MHKRSKRQIKNLKKVRRVLPLTLEEAIKIIKETANTKFTESVELHANLNIDPKYSDQQLRATVILPHKVEKLINIAVFTKDENIPKVKSYGIEIAGEENLINEINVGNINFELLLTTPDMMPKLARLGKILGPKGLMPSLKSGTVTTNLKLTIEEFQKGKFEYKSDKSGIVHLNFGKVNFTNKQLIENLFALYKSIEQNRPSGIKGKYFKNLFICTTMGPSVQLDMNLFI